MRNRSQEQNEVRNSGDFGLVKIVKLCSIVNWEGNDWGWEGNVEHSLAVRKWKRIRTVKTTRINQQRKKPWDHLIKSFREANHGGRLETWERKGQGHDLISCRMRKSNRAKGGWRTRCMMKRS